MESRHDSENAERILFNMRPRELVRKLLKAVLIMCNLKGTIYSMHVRGNVYWLSLLYQGTMAHQDLLLQVPQKPHDSEGLCDLGPYFFIGFIHFKCFS